MILPYKVYTVCGRALEDVYSSKGGSLRTGGDFRCFHLDVAGFYRLLEMMVAFGRVVDQVAEFEAFHLFPVLSVAFNSSRNSGMTSLMLSAINT